MKWTYLDPPKNNNLSPIGFKLLIDCKKNLLVGQECHAPPKFDLDLVLVANLVFLCCRLGWGWLLGTITPTSMVVYPTKWVYSFWLSYKCVTYVGSTSMSPRVIGSLLLSYSTLDMDKDYFVLWFCPFPMLVSICLPSSTSPLDVGGNFHVKKHKRVINVFKASNMKTH
jgi:hypothetical protein